jgi:hypothetical protein
MDKYQKSFLISACSGYLSFGSYFFYKEGLYDNGDIGAVIVTAFFHCLTCSAIYWWVKTNKETINKICNKDHR